MTSNDVTLYDVVVRLDRLTGHVISMDKRLEKVESRLDGVETRLENLEARTLKLEQATTTIEHNVDILRLEQAHIRSDIAQQTHIIYWGFAIIGIVIALVDHFRKDKGEKETPSVIVYTGNNAPAPEKKEG